MRYCTFCSREVPERAHFCGNCGHAADVLPLQIRLEERDTIPVVPWFSDGPTAISHLSSPDNEIMPLAQQRGSDQGAPFGSQTQTAWMPLDGQDVRFPSRQETEAEEQDRLQRALVWGVPMLGAAPEGWLLESVPMAQGTPQVGSVPSVAGTPPAVRHVKDAQHLHQDAPHRAAQSQHIQPHKNASPQRSAVSKQALHGATRWIAVVMTAVVVLTTAGVGVVFAIPPSLSLAGNSKAILGEHLKLHGSGFVPGGHVTLKRDNGYPVQLADQNSVPTQTGGVSSPGLVAANIGGLQWFSASQNETIEVSTTGTFDTTVRVGADWQQGDHKIQASEDVLSRTATMEVMVDPAAAALSVAPTHLDFGSIQKGSKTSLALAIGNTGGKPLPWSADTGGTNWLTLLTTSGDVLPNGAPQSISVVCDTTLLAVGTYSATLHILSAVGNADVKVFVHVVLPLVQKIAKLAVSPNTLDFQTMSIGQQATQTVAVSNTGTLKLGWQAAVSNAGWITLDTTAGSIQQGGAPQNINVQVDTTNLSAGSYTATVTVSSNGGNAQVSILLVVSAPIVPTVTPTTVKPTATTIPPTATTIPPTATTVPPTATTVPPTATTVASGIICKLPDTLDFGSVRQGQTKTLPVTLGNCGNAAYNWRSGPDRSNQWIVPDPAGGTLNANTSVVINVTVVISSSMTTGSYQGSLNFVTTVGNQTVTVSVTVIPVPIG